MTSPMPVLFLSVAQGSVRGSYGKKLFHLNVSSMPTHCKMTLIIHYFHGGEAMRGKEAFIFFPMLCIYVVFDFISL